VAVLLKLKMTFVVVPVAGLYVGAVDPAAIQPAKDQVNEARGNSAACSNTLGGGGAGQSGQNQTSPRDGGGRSTDRPEDPPRQG
jgi:hypothetical protein